MSRTVAVTESEWSEDDVAQLIASRQIDLEKNRYGTPIDEATDPANQDAFKGRDKPRVDWQEKADRDAQDKYYKEWDKPDNPVNRNGHIWGAYRVD